MKRSPAEWVRELLTNPKAAEALTTPQLATLVRDLKGINLGLGGAQVDLDSPSAMAVALSKGRWQSAKHLEMISEWLVDMEDGKRNRLLVSCPPRHGKSLLISYWFPLWFLARHPDMRVILCSYEADFAREWGMKVRNGVISYGQYLNIQLDPAMTAANNWKLTGGGGMWTAGAGGAITGKGAELLIIDDPIKNEEEASSDVMREKLWDWWQTTALTRLEPSAIGVVIIGTRWHQDDLIGRLEAQSLSGEGLPWDVLKLPAYAEEEDPLEREIGEALWPERWPIEKLQQKEQGMSPYHWGATHQQRPSPAEGGAVKRTWWKFYEVPPAEFDQMIQSWDLAFKDLQKSDYTVGQVWGRKGAEFWLLHQVRARMNAPETLQAIRNMSQLYPKAVGKLIEDKANGPAVIAMLAKEVYGIMPVKVRAGKDARLSAVIPVISAGNVNIPHPSIAPWVTAFVEECAAFPHGTNDDQVDSMVHGLTYMLPAGWNVIGCAQDEAKRPAQASTTNEMLQAAFHKRYAKLLKKADRRFAALQTGIISEHHRPKMW